MDAGVVCSKEMVELLMKIKKHLKTNHGRSISMSDNDVMNKLLDLVSLQDSLLLSMVQYFMVLAGPEWSKAYDRRAGAASGKESSLKSFAGKVKEALAAEAAVDPEKGAPVRYYRGQPIYA